MISLLVGIIILLVIVYVARLVVGEFGLPPKITKLVYLAIGLIALFYFFGLGWVIPLRPKVVDHIQILLPSSREEGD